MRQQKKSITETTSESSRNIILGIHHAGNKLSKLISFVLFGAKNPPTLVVALESMHLNAPGTSAVLPLLVTAQLIDVFQLVVETQETELIRTVSLNSLCKR